MSRESAVERAKEDLAHRLKIKADAISEKRVSDREFADMSLGAPAKDEMAAQMISYGWQIELEASGKSYEYRADKYQLRLFGYDGQNFLIQ